MISIYCNAAPGLLLRQATPGACGPDLLDGQMDWLVAAIDDDRRCLEHARARQMFVEMPARAMAPRITGKQYGMDRCNVHVLQ